MKYENRKNGKIATLGKIDEKFKTVYLVYDEDGKDTTISLSTLKRWWKELPEEQNNEASKYVEVSQKITKELNKNNSKSLEQMVEEQADEHKLVQMPGTDGDWGKKHFAPEEEVAGDGTPLVEVGKEIAKQAKQKSKEAKKKEKGAKKSIAVSKKEKFNTKEILDYIDGAVQFVGGTSKVSKSDEEKIKYELPGVKKIAFCSTLQKKSVKIHFRSDMVNSEIANKCVRVNLTFDCRYKIEELNDETKKFVDELIDVILETSEKEEK